MRRARREKKHTPQRNELDAREIENKNETETIKSKIRQVAPMQYEYSVQCVCSVDCTALENSVHCSFHFTILTMQQCLVWTVQRGMHKCSTQETNLHQSMPNGNYLYCINRLWLCLFFFPFIRRYLDFVCKNKNKCRWTSARMANQCIVSWNFICLYAFTKDFIANPRPNVLLSVSAVSMRIIYPNACPTHLTTIRYPRWNDGRRICL